MSSDVLFPVNASSSHHDNNWSYPAVNNVPQPPTHLLTICTFLYVIIFLFGLMGNMAVILVVLQCRSMRTSINLLFLNLCLADLFGLVITGPTVVVDMFAREVWYLGPFMCKLVSFLENVCGNASAVTILAISYERHRVACRASTNTSDICSLCKSFLAIWLTSVLASLPMIFIAQMTKEHYLDNTPVMRCDTSITLVWHKVYLVVSTMLFFILPLVVIFLLYTKVYRKLLLLFRREQARQLGYPREIVRLKRQMRQIIIAVVLVFFICHTPYRTIVLWLQFAPPNMPANMTIEGYLTMIYMTRILLYSNHAINPFVYNFVSRKFRRALLWLCCDRRRRSARLDDWKDLVNNRHPIRMESLRQHRQSTGGRLFDIDNNIRDKDREDAELSDRLNNHFQRNDFLVLYKNLLLE
ncbi:trissin receptor [Aplysia californica]|uniref:Trissin receptor n=1 Tax=Aplysia californica TaxID=6500 RepID=A0ABM1VS07_APLCA|nr:trissin receptor [Aplysia californica]